MILPEKPEAGTRCARCGAEFPCGMQAGERECWCASLPPLTPVPGRGCLCRNCLELELRAPG
ncbi:MAG TPA: cysteine-rich CWC family protein [Burkholderiales bacterium]